MLHFIKRAVKIITNCYKMFHFMETNPTKPPFCWLLFPVVKKLLHVISL